MTPHIGSGGLKIEPHHFLIVWSLLKPELPKKSILAQKSYGSCGGSGSERGMTPIQEPHIESGGLIIYTPSFSDNLIPTKARTAKKKYFRTKILRELRGGMGRGPKGI